MFTKEPVGTVPLLDKRTEEVINDVCITYESVLKILKKVDPNKSCGPDEIHQNLLNELAEVLAELLGNLFKVSLHQGKIPDEWCKANVSPIYKKGSKKKAENYRPVSLT